MLSRCSLLLFGVSKKIVCLHQKERIWSSLYSTLPPHGTMAGHPNSSLLNSLSAAVSEDGRVTVKVDERSRGDEEPSPRKKAKQEPAPMEPPQAAADGSIPESVLQYERQLRKVQAGQRSMAELSKEKHLRIIHEDDDIIVTDKPPGVLCVPGIHDKPNLLRLVCEYLGLDSTKSEMIVHRLDMDTSGLVVFSKTQVALKGLQAAFRDRKVGKEYHALLCGHLPSTWKEGDIHLPLQRDHKHPPFMRVATPLSEIEAAEAVKDLQTHGFKKLVKKKPKPSHTEFRIVQREYWAFSEDVEDDTKGPAPVPVTRVALIPHTGRTHQLRVHCAAIGFPIVGDPTYGIYGEAQSRGGLDSADEGAPLSLQKQINTLRPTYSNSMCLHAAKLSFQHPTKDEKVALCAPTLF